MYVKEISVQQGIWDEYITYAAIVHEELLKYERLEQAGPKRTPKGVNCCAAEVRTAQQRGFAP